MPNNLTRYSVWIVLALGPLVGRAIGQDDEIRVDFASVGPLTNNINQNAEKFGPLGDSLKSWMDGGTRAAFAENVGSHAATVVDSNGDH